MPMLPARRALAAAALSCAWSLLPASAGAQDTLVEPTTFSDATGAMWGVGTFELSLGFSLLTMAAGEACDDDFCPAIGLLGSSLAAVAVGGLTDGYGTPPDVPFLVHQLAWGAGASFVFWAMLFEALDIDDDDFLPFALVLGALSGLGMSTYAYLRRDALLRDPDGTEGAHFMTWAPAGAALLFGSVAAMAELDEEVAMLLAAGSALLAWGLGVALAETQLSQ